MGKIARKSLVKNIEGFLAESCPHPVMICLSVEATEAVPGDRSVAVLHHHLHCGLAEHRLAPLREIFCTARHTQGGYY